MEHSNQLDLVLPFASAFAEALAAALTLRQAAPWDVKCLDSPGAAMPLDKAVNVRLSLTGGLQGTCLIAFDPVHVATIGSQLVKEPALIDDPESNALDEVLAAAMEKLTAALFGQYGVVSVQVERVDEALSQKMLVVALAASSDEEKASTVLLRFDEALVASLTSSNELRHSAKAKKTAIEPTNLQLVMDVELNVSLRFGQCQLPLRDVLDLNTGSVIELDRDVDDPVELLLDGKVIARGEAVIVDGNYGLRITEIPQPIASHFSSQPYKG